MSDANILKEFLVAIGFQVDEGKYKKTKKTLDGVEKAIAGIGAVIGTVVAAVKVGVEDMEDELEGLYFASQRIGSSVREIKAAGFAIGQMGGNSKAAVQSIENLAEAIRSNPSMEGLLNGLGVRTREGNGELRGRVEIFRDLAKQLQAMDYRVAKQRAELLGIDPNTLQAIRRGELESFMSQYRAMSEDVDLDANAKGAHEFMNSVRELLASLQLMAMIVASRWAPALKVVNTFLAGLGALLLKLDKWTDGWSTRLLSLVVVLAGAVAAFGMVTGGLAGVGAAFVAVGAVISAPVALIVAAIAALGIGAYELIKHWAGVAGFFEGLWLRIANAFEEGVRRSRKALDDLKRGDVGQAITDLRTSSKPPEKPPSNDNGPVLEHHPGRDVLDKHVPQWIRTDQDKDTAALQAERAKLQKKLRDNDFFGTETAKANSRRGAEKRIGELDQELRFRNVGPNVVIHGPEAPTAPPRPPQPAPHPRPPAAPAASQAVPKAPARTVSDRIAQAIAFFRSKGWTREQATGIVANLLGENDTLDPHRRERLKGGRPGPGLGIAQWTDKARVQRFKKWFGHDLVGSTFTEQLAFLQRELETTERPFAAGLRRARTAVEAAVASVAFERPRDAVTAMRQRADIARQLEAGTYPGQRGAGLQFSQTTTIQVQQGPDAQATGRAVAREQSRVNGELTRSLKGVVG
jgi:hypothetical protein